MRPLYIASVSWGKDSTAMLIELLRRGYHLDEVVFFDTGMEFEEIYQTRDIFLPILEKRNIKYTELQPRKPFKYLMLEHQRKDGRVGYGWCGGACRWFTSEKLIAIKKHLKGVHCIEYVGIAADEPQRLERLTNTNKKAPLVELGITEKDALKICYDNGVTYNGLYDKVVSRASCWCCRNKNLKELKNYALYRPSMYHDLVELEKQIGENMKGKKSLIERYRDFTGEEYDS